MSGNVKLGYSEMAYEGMIFQTCYAVENSA